MRTPLARPAAVVAALLSAVCLLSGCDILQLGTSRAAPVEPTVSVPRASRPAPVAPRTTQTPPPAEPAPVRRPAAWLRAKLIRPHGTLVVDTSGMTLYRSDKDRASPSRSRCVGTCAATWKPVLVTGAPVRVLGIDPALVGSVARAGGHRQVTIAGWPVYRFVHDRKPGDVAGQCRGGFFAITPEGTKSM